MFKRGPVLIVLVALAAAAGTAPVWPQMLPRIRLLDPLGTEFRDDHLKPRGVVMVVTAPIQSQGSAQQAWHDLLVASHKGEQGPAVVMLEDMSQSWFRPVVLARMKDVYRPGTAALLLLDENGATRKAMGVSEDATVAFAFAPGGKLAAVETGAASHERAAKLLEAARQQ